MARSSFHQLWDAAPKFQIRLPDKLTHCWKFLQEARAVWRPLQLGLRGREAVEVIAGLKADDRVVAPVNPQAGALKPGQRVAVEADLPRDPAGIRP